jgi:DNA-binding transcriptional ArsR family regulator
VFPQVDTRMAKAVAHPIRAEALRILNERVASPSEIAKELELAVANVSYHVNTLLRLGCIEEVEHRHVRGAVEHRYRAIKRPLTDLPDTAAMPANVRHSFAATIFTNAMKDCAQALEKGTVEKRPDIQFTYTPMELDAEGWGKIYALIDEVYEAIEKERLAAQERIDQGAEAVPARLTVLFYEGAKE